MAQSVSSGYSYSSALSLLPVDPPLSVSEVELGGIVDALLAPDSSTAAD